MNSTRPLASSGFTLIEILVVIAIIGVLSATVLSALDTARNKGNDAAVKSSMAAMRAQAELFYDANSNAYVSPGGGGTATDLCAPTGSVNGIRGLYTQFLIAAQAYGLVVGANIQTGLVNGGNATKATCHAADSTHGVPVLGQWAAEVPLRNGPGTPMFCVDSTGFAGTTTGSTLAANDTQCN